MVDEAHTVETEEQAAAAPLPVQLLDEGGGGAASRTTGGALCAGRSRLWRGRARLVARRQLEGRRRLVQPCSSRTGCSLETGGGSSSLETSCDGRLESQASGPHLSPRRVRRRPALIPKTSGGDYLKKWR
jgi:hypothetical protein